MAVAIDRDAPTRHNPAVREGRRASDYPYFDNGGLPLAFAHRGGALTEVNLGLENTLVAIQAAIDLGYRYLETDVHATSDGVLLAFHDPTLDRATDQLGPIANLSYDVVRKARISGREPIPLLSEVLTSWPDLHLNIDAKSVAAIPPLAKVIAQHKAWDRVCVASFSNRRLRLLRQVLGPRVASSYGSIGVTAMRLLPTRRLRGLALAANAQAMQVPVRAGRIEVVTRAFIDRSHAEGLHVHVWTVDDVDEMNRLLDLGVDGIMTDRIDTLRQVYESRGIWTGRSA
jgi:glycerophosphoryl diester phosphodiesterase